jgi:glycosyltransferase involved in cell wall biosynthesis
MASAKQAAYVETHEGTKPRPSSGKHICLVDYGNYQFLFDLVTVWPRSLGRMSYIFGSDQIGRNTAAASIMHVDSGGVVEGLKVTPPSSADKFFSRYQSETQTARATIEKLDLLNPDVVIGANNPLDVQWHMVEWCRVRRKPFLFWLQDLRGMATRSILRRRIPFLGGLVGQYYISLEQRLLRQSAHVISIAEEFRPHVLSSGLAAGRMSVIPNWAPIRRLPIRPKDNEWARSVGLSEKRVALYTGNLGMKHNPAHLLALCEALKDQPDASVAVIAEGVGATWLAEKAKERGLTNLFMHPFVNGELLPDVLGCADTYMALLEPDASNFSVPSKIWTYMCGAKPLVLAMPRDNQAAMIVRRIGAGVFSDPSDEAQFVSNCCEMLSKDPADRAVIGARGRKFAESNFDVDTIVERVSRCIDLAISA